MSQNHSIYEGWMNCDEYCCWNELNQTFCFGEHNLSDLADIREWQPWEEGIRWSMTSILAGCGITGNVLLITILFANRLLLKTSINVFILNMALADLTTTITGSVPFTIRDKPRLENWILGEAWCKLENSLQLLPMIVSVFTLATISIDRMLGVVKPLHRYIKAHHAIIIAFTIWIFSSCIVAPFGMYMEYTTKIWNDTTEHNCGEVSKVLKYWYPAVNLLLTWVPLLVMLISYITVFINFQNYTKSVRSREHPAILHVKKRVFQMMFIVVALFNVSWMPFMVFQICSIPGVLFVDHNGLIEDKYLKVYKTFNSVSHYMMYISPAVNPYLYALLHRNYRRALRVTFPCIFKKSGFMLTPRDGGRGYAWSRSQSHSKSLCKTRPTHRNNHPSTPNSKANSTGSATIKRFLQNWASREKNDVEIRINGRSVTSFQMTATLKTEMLDYKRHDRNKVSEPYPEALSPRKLLPVHNNLNLLIMEIIEEENSSDLDSSERQL